MRGGGSAETRGAGAGRGRTGARGRTMAVRGTREHGGGRLQRGYTGADAGCAGTMAVQGPQGTWVPTMAA
ncbi:hypothetical protein [Paenibacillus solanacearum]|uniref:hypothetical protein n=1 Tax=Paenibacillus solanacearum TaxID=2048548 RepID=UPI001C402BBD|nr:hypothetical protein [Paenibacillus solanacearum]